MKIEWHIEKGDIDKIHVLIEEQQSKRFVKKRIARNINENTNLKFSEELFWEKMILCLLSSQQKSGSGSPISNFCKLNPFHLRFEECSLHKNMLNHFVSETLQKFGGIRNYNNIASAVAQNFKWLNENGWNELEKITTELVTLRNEEPSNNCIPLERRAARFVSKNLKGFGPKQSRNLWQTLGLSRFEIPIDSRITKWLNKNDFPFKLSAKALSDINYYEFVMTGMQKLCAEADVLPCLLDAAIFASFDPQWAEEESIW